jgi:hypothetical protein
MSTTSYFLKLSTWIERKQNHNYALVLRNVKFWKVYNKQWNLPTTLFNEKILLQSLKCFFGIWKQDMSIFIKNTKYFMKFQLSFIKCKKGYQPQLNKCYKILKECARKKLHC